MVIQFEGALDVHPIEQVTDRVFREAQNQTLGECETCKNGWFRKKQELETVVASESAPANTAGSQMSYCNQCQTTLDRVTVLLKEENMTNKMVNELEGYTGLHTNKLNSNPYLPKADPLLITQIERGTRDVLVFFDGDVGQCEMRGCGYEVFCGLIYDAAKSLAEHPAHLKEDSKITSAATEWEESVLKLLTGGKYQRDTDHHYAGKLIPTIDCAQKAGMPCWQLMGGTFPSIIGPAALGQLSKDLERIKPEFDRLQKLNTPEYEDWTNTFENMQEVASAHYAWF